MQKILIDTLQKNGRWSKQSLSFLVCLVFTCISGTALIVLSYTIGLTSNPTAENVFITFAGLTATFGGLNIWNKKVDRKTSPEIAEDEIPN